jgi:hypothetical protein
VGVVAAVIIARLCHAALAKKAPHDTTMIFPPCFLLWSDSLCVRLVRLHQRDVRSNTNSVSTIVPVLIIACWSAIKILAAPTHGHRMRRRSEATCEKDADCFATDNAVNLISPGAFFRVDAIESVRQ